MNINWKIRLTNPYFYVALFMAIFAPVAVYLGINNEDLTSWGTVLDVLKEAVMNPYLLVTVVMSVANFLIDPTTKGIGDSQEVMQLDRPKDDGL